MLIRRVLISFLAVFLLASVLWAKEADALTLTVKDYKGNPVGNYRWLIEEDTTHPVKPNTFDVESTGVGIHKSYSPVVATGFSNTSTTTINVPSDKRYYVSVLPLSGYSMGGYNVKAGQTSVTVVVEPHPLPTAQISVHAFIDNAPTNGVPDPGEPPLAGFEVYIFDNLGQVTTDVFGNNLGTTYVFNATTGSYEFDADGNPIVETMGNGIFTDANGNALIKNLAPNKYGIRVVPRDGKPWAQTSTIEGTPGIDAWVKAGEPPLLNEFGLLFWHAFFGFVLAEDNIPHNSCGPTGTEPCTGSITGQIVKVHSSKPPLLTPNEGGPVSMAWIGLTPLTPTVPGIQTIYTGPCDPETGEFTINGVPPGTYQIVSWDLQPNLDMIMGFSTVIVTNSPSNPNGDPVDVGKVPMNAWFGYLEGYVFNDLNENGIYEPGLGETGLMNRGVNLRFRDGSIYQAQVTDMMGYYQFPEVFPFFKWLIVEVDFLNKKATGATVVVDNGGALSTVGGEPANADPCLFEGCPPNRVPQKQPENGNKRYRVETGPVLLEGMMLFADQTNRIDWGKTEYAEGENGGITGVIGYQTTRAEFDPREATIDPWEPGIPRVQVNLYQDSDGDGVIDDLNGDGKVTLSDVDNYPFGNFPGPEDIDRNGNGVFNGGDAISVVHSDSFDDSPPTGCVDPLTFVYNGPIPVPLPVDCAETLRTWNQVRPAVFDGGYAFSSYHPGGLDSGSPEVEGLPAGIYIVEVSPPPGYEVQKEEDYNVTIGDVYSPALLMPPCVGDLRVVPDVLSLDGVTPTPLAGQVRPLCDRKQIVLGHRQNAAVDFHLFTLVPKAARIIGLVTNDLVNTFNRLSPNAAEKLSPSWLPISIRDFRGVEVSRTYSDEYGIYENLVPGTFTASVPTPSGVSPNMVTICLNDPGPIEDPLNPGRFITDPLYKPGYGQACYNMDVWSAKITYADTPVIPIAAFSGIVGSGISGALDCEYPDKTPLIYSVSGPFGGPYVSGPGQKITITAFGPKQVDNPDYNPNVAGSPVQIVRDYGFGGIPGKVLLGDVPLTNVVWSSDGRTVSAVVPEGAKSGQLNVVRGDNGAKTPIGVTLHVGDRNILKVLPGRSIQQVIDRADPGDLILVPPGVYYENLIMWKPVRLQGWGAGSTVIDATGFVPDREQAWSDLMDRLIATGEVELIPGQTTFATPAEAQQAFPVSSGAVITVLGNATSFSAAQASIDGFTIRGAQNGGGGIFLSGHASGTSITNNIIKNNQGNFGGGVRIGWPNLPGQILGTYQGSFNDNITVSRNQIALNGSMEWGGGISIYGGSDNYSITDNLICGNFSRRSGGGISHYGLSSNGRIERNRILFNESFYVGTVGGEGGGVFLGGEPPAVGAGTLTLGAGTVTINSNLIQGNIAGKGGGGICTRFYNGQDVTDGTVQDYALNIFNNFIVDNVSHYLGGGIELSDNTSVNIVHNTIAHNDSTATHVEAFQLVAGQPNLQVSTPVAAGLVARAHSLGLAQASGQSYANPLLYNNIFWRNRSFYWDINENNGLGGLLPNPTRPYWDLEVFGTAGSLNPMYSILTDTTGYDASNISSVPAFRVPYFNTLYTSANAQEGGNFVSVIFTPLKTVGDYRLMSSSPAIGLAGNSGLTAPELGFDIEGQARPYGATSDSGADEYAAGGAARAFPLSSVSTGALRESRRASFSPAIYSISGSVMTKDKRPASGVTVELNGPAVLKTTTDAQGRYRFDGLPEGRYEIKVSRDGASFKQARKTVTLRGSDAKGVNFVEVK